jgi:hypothetical protein
MSSDSSSNGKKLSSESNNSAPKRTQPSTNSSIVREFLYLDLPKLFSYLSQITGGRQLLIQRVEEQFKIDEKSEPTQIEAVKFEIDAALSGKIPFFADGNLHGLYGKDSSTQSGDVRTKTGKFGSRVTVSTIYHEALKLVQDELGDRLVSLEGRLAIIDFRQFIGFAGGYGQFIKDFNAVTGQKLKDEAHTKQLASILNVASSDRLLILLREENARTSTAYLSRENLTTDIQNIIDNYGARPKVKFTLIGLDATSDEVKTDFSTNFFQDHDDGQQMGLSLIEVMQQLEALLGFWQLKSKESHIFPLAIYRDL